MQDHGTVSSNREIHMLDEDGGFLEMLTITMTRERMIVPISTKITFVLAVLTEKLGFFRTSIRFFLIFSLLCIATSMMLMIL